MMAQSVPHHTTDKKRVKVYELRDNDWFDRGTGFCTAAFTQVCYNLLASLVLSHSPPAFFPSHDLDIRTFVLYSRL